MASSLLIISLLVVCLTLVCADLPENPEEQLKPLDPIAGTNLFYNLPYRWLDDTKPGCFVTWFCRSFKGPFVHYRYFEGRNRQVDLVCNNADQKWYNDTDSEWIFEKPKPNLVKTNGDIAIKNIGSGYTLERLTDGYGTEWVAVDGFALRAKYGSIMLGDYKHMPDIHTWNVLGDPKNKNRVQLEIDGKQLTQHNLPNHRAHLFVTSLGAVYENLLLIHFEEHYPYTFVPTLALELDMDEFEFVRPIGEDLAKHTSQKALIDEYTIHNPSAASVRRTVEVSHTVRNEFSWGLSWSIKNALKIKGKAGIPFLAEGEIENTFEAGYGRNKNWKSGEDKTIKLSYEVSVPPNKMVKISAWYDHIKDLRMDYTARAVITGATKRVTLYDDIVEGVPATGEMIQKQLENSGFDGKIVETKKDCVIVRVKGSMVATVGVRGRLNVNDDIVASSEPK